MCRKDFWFWQGFSEGAGLNNPVTGAGTKPKAKKHAFRQLSHPIAAALRNCSKYEFDGGGVAGEG